MCRSRCDGSSTRPRRTRTCANATRAGVPSGEFAGESCGGVVVVVLSFVQRNQKEIFFFPTMAHPMDGSSNQGARAASTLPCTWDRPDFPNLFLSFFFLSGAAVLRTAEGWPKNRGVACDCDSTLSILGSNLSQNHGFSVPARHFRACDAASSAPCGGICRGTRDHQRGPSQLLEEGFRRRATALPGQVR